ncbi:MAG: leucine--tRNA ligase [Gammaproteobacteria bacterium]|nr:leucine--tRNA ligase [Gammaproteobacteria bacterium]MCY4276252.1 leucine--tRNA ligase [Gammaproteobacteria bacterium]
MEASLKTLRVPAYLPVEVEHEAQAYWKANGSHEVDGSAPAPEDHFYCLEMFPYPSGSLHMGHVRAYTVGDVIARYRRLKGKTVIQPMGWDAFGLPAENAAIERNVPPARWTAQNIENMRSQFNRLGFAFDWSREVTTCEPEYYKGEQWFFLQLYKKGLVYRKNSMVNWDPVEQTVLANEQVENGRGWRSGAKIERREMPQWFLKITDYADELLEGLEQLPDWPEQVKAMQRNWINRSTGVEIDFAVGDENIPVFTTRADTLFGVTYLALSPEHPLVAREAEQSTELARFVKACRRMSTAEADMAREEKIGVRLSIDATHPLTGDAVPVYAANFVLMEYGSGAVMAVPGHDQRDWEFASNYGLAIKQVISPTSKTHEVDLSHSAFTAHGVLINSPGFDGLKSADAIEAIADALESRGAGRRRITYRLRDWLVSRQRYWGCPIPMIHCKSCGVVPVPESDLPVVLPTNVEFRGVQSPLVDMPEFLNVTCPICGGKARRETDTFDTFFESSWYYARFASPQPHAPMIDAQANSWLPVDVYVGGIEHAILHLLYARFFHKLMRDADLIDSDEPFEHLLLIGMVLKDGKKMSKSSGRGADPDKLYARYGADAVRLATIFAAPPTQSFEWRENSVPGALRFLRRVWTLGWHNAETKIEAEEGEESEAALALRRLTRESLAKADDDYGRRLHFNTVVSTAMSLANAIAEIEPCAATREATEALLVMLSPIAPHITHFLWFALGKEKPIIDSPWPNLESVAQTPSLVELGVQVNGKFRGVVEVAPDADQERALDAAHTHENIGRFLREGSVRKVIYVPGRILNVVVR